jgi:hypothetical protein
LNEGLSHIGSYSFSNCEKIEELVIPNTVGNIDNFAFSHCTSLTKVIVHNASLKFGYGVFYNCTNLSSIIWNNIEYLDKDKFNKVAGNDVWG